MAEISVIVPVYKVEKYLKRCVDSIINQTFTDFDLILVNDGSPDNSAAICEEYASKDSRVHVIHQENGGLSAARNSGIDWAFVNSTSEWICFVDSDDWVHPQYLELLYKSALDYSVSISACRFKKVISLEESDLSALNPAKRIIDPETLYTHDGKGIYAYAWNKLYKKELWADIKFPKGRNWEDTVTTYKVLLAVQKTVFVDADLYFYYINPEGIVNRDWTPKKMDHLWAIRQALKSRMIKSRPELVKLFHKQEIFTILEQLRQIDSSCLISHKEKKKFSSILRRKMRMALLSYGKSLQLDSKTRKLYFEIACPKMNWIYWTGIGVTNRIRKMVK